jgi:hypothetical protein
MKQSVDHVTGGARRLIDRYGKRHVGSLLSFSAWNVNRSGVRSSGRTLRLGGRRIAGHLARHKCKAIATTNARRMARKCLMYKGKHPDLDPGAVCDVPTSHTARAFRQVWIWI